MFVSLDGIFKHKLLLKTCLTFSVIQLMDFKNHFSNIQPSNRSYKLGGSIRGLISYKKLIALSLRPTQRAFQ